MRPGTASRSRTFGKSRVTPVRSPTRTATPAFAVCTDCTRSRTRCGIVPSSRPAAPRPRSEVGGECAQLLCSRVLLRRAAASNRAIGRPLQRRIRQSRSAAGGDHRARHHCRADRHLAHRASHGPSEPQSRSRCPRWRWLLWCWPTCGSTDGNPKPPAPARARVPLGRIGGRRGQRRFWSSGSRRRSSTAWRTPPAPGTSRAYVAPLTEEAVKGLFLVLMSLSGPPPQRAELADGLPEVYAGMHRGGAVGHGSRTSSISATARSGRPVAAHRRDAVDHGADFAHPLFTDDEPRHRGVLRSAAPKHRRQDRLHPARIRRRRDRARDVERPGALLGARGYLLVYLLWMVPIFGLAVWLAVSSRRREQRVVASRSCPQWWRPAS